MALEAIAKGTSEIFEPETIYTTHSVGNARTPSRGEIASSSFECCRSGDELRFRSNLPSLGSDEQLLTGS